MSPSTFFVDNSQFTIWESIKITCFFSATSIAFDFAEFGYSTKTPTLSYPHDRPATGLLPLLFTPTTLSHFFFVFHFSMRMLILAKIRTHLLLFITRPNAKMHHLGTIAPHTNVQVHGDGQSLSLHPEAEIGVSLRQK